jgi:hypothetical protein
MQARHPESSPLRAYLATALTGLADNERSHVSEVSDLAAATCAEFGIELYEPRKAMATACRFQPASVQDVMCTGSIVTMVRRSGQRAMYLSTSSGTR